MTITTPQGSLLLSEQNPFRKAPGLGLAENPDGDLHSVQPLLMIQDGPMKLQRNSQKPEDGGLNKDSPLTVPKPSLLSKVLTSSRTPPP